MLEEIAQLKAQVDSLTAKEQWTRRMLDAAKKGADAPASKRERTSEAVHEEDQNAASRKHPTELSVADLSTAQNSDGARDGEIEACQRRPWRGWDVRCDLADAVLLRA